jgi:hypothetical protein
MCLKLHEVVLVPDSIHMGGIAVVNGIPFLVVRQTPTIVYAVGRGGIYGWGKGGWIEAGEGGPGSAH